MTSLETSIVTSRWLSEPLRVAFVLLSAAFAVVAIIGWLVWRLMVTDQWIDHTREVSLTAGSLLRNYVDAETGQRGYLLTMEEGQLSPYLRAKSDVGGLWNKLKELTSDNPVQQRLIDKARGFGETRMALIEKTIDLTRSNRHATAIEIVKRGEGRSVMEDLRTQLAAVESEESRLLDERRRQAATLATWTMGATALGLFLGVFALWRVWNILEEEQRGLEALVRERTRALEIEKNRVTILLDDFHHRIGNSLAIVGSILNHYESNATSADVKDSMRSARQRLQTIAASQRRLHLRTGEDIVLADEYLERLLSDIESLIEMTSITVRFEGHPIELSSREASSLGVVMGELVINSVKHAFPGVDDGQIVVRFKRNDIGIVLEVEDNGLGSKGEPGSGRGIGKRILQSMLHNLNATSETEPAFESVTRPGTRHRITLMPAAKRSAHDNGSGTVE